MIVKCNIWHKCNKSRSQRHPTNPLHTGGKLSSCRIPCCCCESESVSSPLYQQRAKTWSDPLKVGGTGGGDPDIVNIYCYAVCSPVFMRCCRSCCSQLYSCIWVPGISISMHLRAIANKTLSDFSQVQPILQLHDYIVSTAL